MLLPDTHAWAWSLTSDSRLSPAVVQAMERADSVAISVISLYEIGQTVRLGKWPELVPLRAGLIALADRQGARFLHLSPEASLMAATLEWEHRDPFDRIIGSIALTTALRLVSADPCFDSLETRADWPGRIR